MKATISYQIDFDVNDDILFGYISFVAKEFAMFYYHMAVKKGCYAKGLSITQEIELKPTITLKEIVLDENEVVRAERIIQRHQLGNEEQDAVECKLDTGFEILYDHIGYYSPLPTEPLHADNPSFGLTL